MLSESSNRLPETAKNGFSSRVQHKSHAAEGPPLAIGSNVRMRHLLKIVIPTFAILITPCGKADAQQLLSAEEIEDQIVGRSFMGKKGILAVTVDYASDGTVTMKLPLGTGKGRWMISDNLFCVSIETGPRKANECMTFTTEADGAYRASNGMRLIPVE